MTWRKKGRVNFKTRKAKECFYRKDAEVAEVKQNLLYCLENSQPTDLFVSAPLAKRAVKGFYLRKKNYYNETGRK